MQRIGILGGTFDPIHLAHLMLASEARHQLSLDQVLLIPSRIPPHKQNGAFASAQQRLHMVQLAIQGEPAFKLCDIELQRSGPSYSVDTVAAIRETLAEHDEVYFIIGWDAFILFDSWHNPRRLAELCLFAVAGRPGAGTVDHRRYPESCPPDRVRPIDVPQMSISSTDVRSRIRDGRPYHYMLPEAVYQYIKENAIY
ncbi:MAG: nicotinate-nucleotide adenylyltransferase [Bacillota bacterium]|jgi:nicotinate-nucleotide adenylyltransferase